MMRNNIPIRVALVALFLGLLSARAVHCDNAVGIQFGEPGTVGASMRFDNMAIGAAVGARYRL